MSNTCFSGKMPFMALTIFLPFHISGVVASITGCTYADGTTITKVSLLAITYSKLLVGLIDSGLNATEVR